MEKINDLSQSTLRQKYLTQTFVAETSLAVAMGRVSTKDQKDEGRSDEAQIERIEEYAMDKGLKIIQSWDVAESASKHEKRKHFIELLQSVFKSQKSNSPIKHIIFSHQSRSNRNRKSARILEDLIREHNVSVHCIRDNLILTNKSPQESWLLWDFFNNFNENFIKEHIKNVMDGTIKRLEAGLYPCRAPMGYRNARLDNKINGFEIDIKTAPLIIKIFELCATGRYSMPMLKDEIDGISQTAFKGARVPSKKYLEKLVRNPFYYGDFIYDKILYKGNPEHHPPLITYDLWKNVQDVLDGKGTKNIKWSEEKFPYIGLIRCGGDIYDSQGKPTGQKCGYAISGETKRKKLVNGGLSFHHYWNCSNNRVGTCSQRDPDHLKLIGAKRYLKQEKLEEMMEEIFRPFCYSDETAKKMMDAYKKYTHQEDDKRLIEIQRISKRIDEIQNLISTSYEDKLNNLIPESLWREKYQKWMKESTELKQLLSSFGPKESVSPDQGTNCIELAKSLYYQYIQATSEKKRKIVEIVASNLVLSDLSIGFKWKKPWSLLPKKGEEEYWISRNLTRDTISLIFLSFQSVKYESKV